MKDIDQYQASMAFCAGCELEAEPDSNGLFSCERCGSFENAEAEECEYCSRNVFGSKKPRDYAFGCELEDCGGSAKHSKD